MCSVFAGIHSGIPEGMFRVVIFPKDGEVAVVSHKWVVANGGQDEDEIFWPPCKSTLSLNKFLTRHAEPNPDTWSRFTGRCVYMTGEWQHNLIVASFNAVTFYLKINDYAHIVLLRPFYISS